MQDELTELEEQLAALDTASQPRSGPESRRASAAQGGDLEWRKIELFNRISLKMTQYNAALEQYRKTGEGFGTPGLAKIDGYKRYLERERPVVPSETGFLNFPHDLIDLDARSASLAGLGLTPEQIAQLQRLKVLQTPNGGFAFHVPAIPGEARLQALALGIAASILVPILSWTIIPTFLGRMSVALCVAVGILGILTKKDRRREEARALGQQMVKHEKGKEAADGRGEETNVHGEYTHEKIVAAGVYALGMAVLAVMIG
jgi:hypothetical protein